MMFFVTGANGVGKTTCIPELRRLLPDFAIHDFDDVGVPADVDVAWRHRTTEHWLQRGIENDREGRHTAICGGALLGEILACPSALEVKIEVCLLDVHDVELVDRLESRGTRATQDALSWAAWQRLHAVDPQWHPAVIRTGSAVGMRWERWADWKRGDARWRVHAIDTTSLEVIEVAQRVFRWISGCLMEHHA